MAVVRVRSRVRFGCPPWRPDCEPRAALFQSYTVSMALRSRECCLCRTRVMSAQCQNIASHMHQCQLQLS
eukprot:2952024-Rhodomonas_salina.1